MNQKAQSLPNKLEVKQFNHKKKLKTSLSWMANITKRLYNAQSN